MRALPDLSSQNKGADLTLARLFTTYKLFDFNTFSLTTKMNYQFVPANKSIVVSSDIITLH